MINFYIPHRIEGEKIILILRRHWFIILGKFIFWGIAALMPFLLYLILFDVFGEWFSSPAVNAILVLFTSIYYLYIWLFAFHSFVDYYLDVWIVTSERVVNIEQKGLFSREVSEQKLHRIQDVTSQLKGFFSTMLDFGTVFVQTAGEKPRFIFKQIPRPQRVAKKIIKIIEQHKKVNKIMEGRDEVHTRKK